MRKLRFYVEKIEKFSEMDFFGYFETTQFTQARDPHVLHQFGF